MFMFHVIRKQKTGSLYLSADTARYVDIKYVHYSKDYNLKPDPSWQVKTEVAARQCELKDFMKFPDNAVVAKEHFEAWKGYSILCPDSDDFNLLGNSASMLQKYFSLEISKCDPAKRSCATDAEIEAFYEDIQVDSWAVQEKMNFLLYGGYDIKPVFLNMDLY